MFILIVAKIGLNMEANDKQLFTMIQMPLLPLCFSLFGGVKWYVVHICWLTIQHFENNYFNTIIACILKSMCYTFDSLS